MTARGMHCCGLAELDGLSDHKTPEAALRSILREDYDGRGYLDVEGHAHVIFTQASYNSRRTGYGYALAAYILKRDLGTVIGSRPKVNPNSGNYVTTFVWTPNDAGIKRWIKSIYAKKK